MKYTYTLENLNCAHCAGKIEQKIINTDGYDNVSFNFATKSLNFYSEREDTLTEIQQICDSIEDGVTVRDSAVKTEAAEKRSFRPEKLLLALGIVFCVAAAVVHFTVKADVSDYLVLGLSLASAVLAGYETFIKGIKNLVKFRIDENVLLLIAVIAAFILREYVEAAVVTALFAVGEFIEDFAVNATRRDIEKLSQIRPDNATLFENGKELEVAAEDVKIGSVIVVRPHERIPLDGVVIEGNSQLDNSALTGESVPVQVERGSEALSGAVNGEGLLKIRTTKEFGDSTAARILQLVEDAAAQKGKSEKLITRFAAVYTPIVIAIAALIAVVPPLIGLGAWSEWIYNALVVLVAACPCAIVISVPLAYFSGIGAASRHGVLIKGGKYLEALAQADAFAFDKTGTLTEGRLNISGVYSADGYTDSEILNLAAACEKYSSHPIAAAIKNAAGKSDIELTDYREIAGVGVEASYNGKKLCCGNDRLVSGIVPRQAENAAVFLVHGAKLIGAVEVSDSIRGEAKGVIAELKKLGINNTVMLTGDSKKNAEGVCAQLDGIKCRAELMPQDKLDIIKSIQQNGNTVCFVGDGINDAPVLSASDCGIAMGLGSEAAIEASDAVLSSGHLSQLPKAVKIARKTMCTIKTNIVFSLLVKAAVILLACFGLAAMWMSVLADTGVCVICVLYTSRLLKLKMENET